MNKEDHLLTSPAGIFNHDHIKRKYLNVTYAFASEAQKLDIYLPETGDGPFPVVIHIHGGAFMMCDKADNQVRPWIRGLELGFAIASVNYRLSGEALFPSGIMDVKAAIRFLRANAVKYNLDSGRFAVAGGSSGGNYACMICTTSRQKEFEDLSMGNSEYSSEVQCGVAWFPPTDFLLMDTHLHENGLGPEDHNSIDSPESRYLGGQITQLEPDFVQKANPMKYVHIDMPPMLIQHGRLDHLVPWQQSKIFVDKIRAVCTDTRIEFDVLETADHADIQFESDKNMEKIFSFIRKNT